MIQGDGSKGPLTLPSPPLGERVCGPPERGEGGARGPRRLGWLALCLLALPFCSTGPSLNGSLGQIFSLSFNQTAIFVNTQGFELDYYLVNQGSEDLVVELTVDLTGITFTPGATVPLGGDIGPGVPRAQVVHQLSGQPVQEMPGILNGSLSLSSGGEAGELTTGSFQLAFVTSDSMLGDGTTLNGSFSAVAGSGAFPVTDGGKPDAGPPDAGDDGGL